MESFSTRGFFGLFRFGIICVGLLFMYVLLQGLSEKTGEDRVIAIWIMAFVACFFIAIYYFYFRNECRVEVVERQWTVRYPRKGKSVTFDRQAVYMVTIDSLSNDAGGGEVIRIELHDGQAFLLHSYAFNGFDRLKQLAILHFSKKKGR